MNNIELVLIFADELNNKKTLIIKDPKENLTTTDVKAACDDILMSQVLMTKTGVVDRLVGAVEITRSTRQIVEA